MFSKNDHYVFYPEMPTGMEAPEYGVPTAMADIVNQQFNCF